MGGYLGKQVVGYVDDIQMLKERLKPWILRREKADVLRDLPEKQYTHVECPMGPEGWRLYREMRDDMVAWLSEADASVASQAAVRVARLSQLTSGFLGGLEGEHPVPVDDAKLQAFLDWLQLQGGAPVIAWCRFRAEMQRLLLALQERGYSAGIIIGGQSDAERQATINLFQQGELQVLVGQPQAGGLGLNLTRSCTVAYLSNDYNLTSRMQSEDRVHRPGQVRGVTYVDFIAIPPEGQRSRMTIDHAVLSALRRKRDLAGWTTQDWKRAIMGEAV